MFRDGRYSAVPWMAKSGYVQGRTVFRGAMDGKEHKHITKHRIGAPHEHRQTLAP